jgi:hypothetical protein
MVANSGSNFIKSFSKEINGALTGGLLGKEINGMAMALGGEIGEPIVLDVKVVASQNNNNEPKESNVVEITITPFADLGIAASKTSVVLSSEMAAETGVTLTWSTAFNGFQAVKTYQLQYAEGETDFVNPITEGVTSFSRSFTQKELNDLALGYGIAPGTEGAIEFRVWATNELGAEIYSNEVSLAVTPYATSFAPLFGKGDGLQGWDNWPAGAVEFVSSEFKKYETVAYFTNGKAFRFFEQLDWGPTSYNYPFFTTVDPVFINASDNDSNLKVDGATGWYKVNVDLVAKTVTAQAVSEPVLYMMGDGLNGWGTWPGDAVKMTYLKPGVYEAEATFSVGAFRFFAQPDWGPASYNFPYFESVDANFENAADNDSNLKYIGTPGVQKITVDLNAKTVSLGGTPGLVLYMTGGALNGWNWDPGTPVRMTYLSTGVFEATATFTSNEIFRFFAQADWGPKSYNYEYFTTVDSEFQLNAGDGDKNLKYLGPTGERTIHVNLITKEITLD